MKREQKKKIGTTQAKTQHSQQTCAFFKYARHSQSWLIFDDQSNRIYWSFNEDHELRYRLYSIFINLLQFYFRDDFEAHNIF